MSAGISEAVRGGPIYKTTVEANRLFLRLSAITRSFCPGEDLEVHYRWHPYFGCKVGVRRVEQRATGRFLKVQGPTGVVVSIAGWMLDPVICAGMIIGPPQVDLSALVDLQRLFMPPANPHTPEMLESFGRKAMKHLKLPGPVSGRQMSLLFDTSRLDGLGSLERGKVVSALAQILLQAAGVRVEELADDQR